MLDELLRKARYKAGEYKDVAKLMDIHPVTLSKIKNGERKPSMLEIMQLADIAELNPVDTLFEVMKEIDPTNANKYENWCARRGSNPRPQASETCTLSN